MLVKYRGAWPSGPAHGNRGRAPHNRADKEVRKKIQELSEQEYKDYNHGRIIRLIPQQAALNHDDGDYLVLHQGQELLLHLPGYDRIEHPVRAWVVAEGYYHPIHQ